ncbi:hypothetical protein EYF80_009562 [Liparis tanakae]|uniref:Uncharacterized protein n=1 Tax=Liparis tanakae TaxID=230148 RepID=A0A4Z2IR37_9TELE|nr:hypothetical protein EYF80_009562 [Liparis tanakae]
MLEPRSAELLEAEIEAEGCRFMLGPPRASAGLPVVRAAVLLAGSSGLVLKQSLGFGISVSHLEPDVCAGCDLAAPHWRCKAAALSCCSYTSSALDLRANSHTLLDQLITPHTLIRARRATVPGQEACGPVTVRHTEAQNRHPRQ